MWIALGVVGVLWFAGMVIWPDKNAPAQSHVQTPPAVATTQAPPPSAPR
ncbi:MAG TPA: hypothetical protein VN802_16425 [Stellaceae bacterium]|nr:hypothetical protein [Stellaceae bacterium]